ncbi:MAPEG family protein [Sulfitobacter aestuariivivens]|uniref:Microsomal glutathione S-transferase 1 n=1 Tax=Sulfitobacter aestuariivivens TaxID=2766981 RepID=A0A927HDR9_9RHOB|nr:MAPEG family protein [Sulfitobacter aestuariivivens]MBD3662589.1 MAPEG family protein [Sulfitobacter aestuariivivens]
MNLLNLDNPVFEVYAIAAALMVLKVMLQGWMTVYRMLKIGSGWASPEDLRKGPINKHPSPEQLDSNEYVERSRRLHRNDLENIPAFLAAGLLFVVIDPILWVAQVLMYGFVLARTAHFIAYATQQSHELRATFYSVGSLIVIYMAFHVMWSVMF